VIIGRILALRFPPLPDNLCELEPLHTVYSRELSHELNSRTSGMKALHRMLDDVLIVPELLA